MKPPREDRFKTREVVFDKTDLYVHLGPLEKVISDSRDGLIVANQRGKIVLFSKIAESLFGYTSTEALGQDIELLMPDDHGAQHHQYVANYRETGKGKILGVGPRELQAKHKDGSPIFFELSISEISLRDDKYFVALCRDISVRKKNAAALQEAHKQLAISYKDLQATAINLASHQKQLTKLNERLEAANAAAESGNKAKSAFLTTMSHELRTPLNGIMGMAQVLSSTNLDQAQKQYLRIITESSEILLTLLNDVLDAAKVESGQLTLDPQPTDVLALANKVADYWKQRCELKGLDFKLILINRPLEAAILDPIRLRQILDNLLGNALKFTEKGQISLVVSVDRSDTQAFLCFDVIDTGIGIPFEYQGKIFQAFTQADNSITRRYGGTGLGLAICKKLITQMGGQICFQSIAGSGTKFMTRFPYSPVEVHPTARAAEPSILEMGYPTSDNHVNILVAEDNKLNQELMTVILRSLNYNFTIVENGYEVIKALEEHAFDIVLMDLHMPKMDGLTTTRAIRARDDRVHSIPIIGLTASAMEKDREECLAAGMSAHMAKPFSITSLRTLIDTLLNTEASEFRARQVRR